MASALIHMAVCKKVNEILKLNEKEIMLGSIAPDVAKMIGSSRRLSHYITKVDSDTPNIELFLDKYKEYLNNPFELGYYIHLLTDVMWFNEFLPNFVDDVYLTSKSGEKIKFEEKELLAILYNDYTNLNAQILDYYNMDLSLFYQEFPFPESHIKEIPKEYFPDIIKRLGLISTNTSNYNYVLDITSITHFIQYASIYCLDEIKKLNI